MLKISLFWCLLGISLLSFTGAQGQTGSIMTPHLNSPLEAERLYEAGQYAAAQKRLDRISAASQRYSASEVADARYLAVRCAIELYNRDAEKRLENFARQYPFHPNLDRLYLAFANQRFSVKQYRDAAQYYQKLKHYRLDPQEQHEYRFKLAYSLLQRQEIEEARRLFAEVKDVNSPYAESSRYYFAHLLYADSAFQQAAENFEQLRGSAKFGAMVPYYLAHIYYGLGDYQKVIEEGRDLIETAKEERAAEMARLIADAYYHRQNYAEAARYLQLYQQKGGAMLLKNHYQLGYSLYQTGRYKEAIASFNKISKGPEELLQKAYYQLGDCYLRTQRKSDAITAFKAASELDALPAVKEDAFYNYAKLAYEVADPYQDAILTLQAYQEAYPQSEHRDEINNYLTNLYITTRDYERALSALEATGLRQPRLRAMYQKVAFYRAGELHQQGQYEPSLAALQRSLEFPVSPRYKALCYYWQGENYYQLGAYQEALSAYQAFRQMGAASALPQFDRSYYQSAYCHFKMLKFEQAVTDFRTFTKAAQGSAEKRRRADAYLRLGDAYLLQRQFQFSIEYYEKALQSGSNQGDYAYFQMAECLGLSNQQEAKVIKLQQILRQFPQSPYAEQARFEIGLTQLSQDQYDQALLSFQQFKKDYSQSGRVAAADLKIGLCYANTDQDNRALSIYRKVVEDYPGSQEAKEAVTQAGLIYKRNNRLEEYLDWVENLAFMNFEESELDSTAYNTAVDVYARGQYPEAIQAFQSYLRRYPKGIFRLEAHFYLADCGEQTDNEKLSAEQYQEILNQVPNSYELPAVRYLCDYRFAQKDYPQALKHYRRWLELAQNRDARQQAQAGIMRTTFILEDYSETLLYAELLLAAAELNKSLRGEAQKLAAESYRLTEQPQQALQAYQKLAAQGQGEEKAMGLYYQAEIYHERGEYQQTKNLVDSLIQSLNAQKDWKMKSLMLLARNFWKQGDIFQANYTLDYLIKTDYSPALTAEASALQKEIEQAERQALQAKKERMKRQQINLPVDAADSLALPLDEPLPNDTLR